MTIVRKDGLAKGNGRRSYALLYGTQPEFVMGFGMFNPMTVQAPLVLWQQMAQIALESQMVIALRTAGMMGFLRQETTEPARMLGEKADAATEAMFAALQAAGRGQRADEVMVAALRPYRKRTRANVKRLSRNS